MRTNIHTIVKTFKFPPELVEDMERVLHLASNDKGKPKYKYLTTLVIAAIRELIKRKGGCWKMRAWPGIISGRVLTLNLRS